MLIDGIPLPCLREVQPCPHLHDKSIRHMRMCALAVRRRSAGGFLASYIWFKM